jgi:hypothetical protein
MGDQVFSEKDQVHFVSFLQEFYFLHDRVQITLQCDLNNWRRSCRMTETVVFSIKGIYYYQKTNYIQPLQQLNTLMAVWVHTAKKKDNEN